MCQIGAIRRDPPASEREACCCTGPVVGWPSNGGFGAEIGEDFDAGCRRVPITVPAEAAPARIGSIDWRPIKAGLESDQPGDVLVRVSLGLR